VMGNVMAEAHVEQACDGCDAKIGNSLVPNESNRNTLSNSNDTVSEDKLASDPSQPLTPEITQTPETQAVIEVEELSEDETLPSPAITPEIVDVDVKESVIAERNKTFPIGSWVRYFDPMSRGFKGELAQVTALHEWSPKHIYVDGQNVFGNVRHAHCKPVSKNECLKLGLSNKLKK
jgi:hypothetical protein